MEPTVESNQVEEFETRPDFPPPPPRCLWELRQYPKNYGPYCATRTGGQSCSEESITISFAALQTTILLGPPTNDTYGSMAI